MYGVGHETNPRSKDHLVVSEKLRKTWVDKVPD